MVLETEEMVHLMGISGHIQGLTLIPDKRIPLTGVQDPILGIRSLSEK
jgi:hypothetical protein